VKRTEIRAVQMVRRIRDRHAAVLAGKTDERAIAFFRQAADRVLGAKPQPGALLERRFVLLPK
jgi:hypothetical protein